MVPIVAMIGIHKMQLRELVRDTLTEIGLWTKPAEELILGTIAQESKMGRYIEQVSGPALGICQMEPKTYEWLQEVYHEKYPWILAPVKQLRYNMWLAIATCRLRYMRDAHPIPADIDGQAAYWKRVYNTPLGAGTEAEYLKNYKELCA